MRKVFVLLAFLGTFPSVLASQPKIDCRKILEAAAELSGEDIRIVRNDYELPQIVALASRVFYSDPLFTFIAPDANDRRAFIATMIQHTWLYGKIIVDGKKGDIDGVNTPRSFALWLPSEKGSASPMDMVRNGMLKYIVTTLWNQPGKLLNLLQLDGYLLKTRRQFAGRNSLYLYLIGVDPHYQHQGYGTRLIGPVIDAAQKTGTPVVLEIQKTENEAYYRRFGFESKQTKAVPNDAPATSTLVWLPKENQP